MPSPLTRYPAFRILLPFAAGILFELVSSSWLLPLLVIVVAIVLYLFLSFQSNSPEERLRLRPYFFLPLAIIAFALGWLAAIVHNPPRIDTAEYNDKILCGRVVNLEYTDFSMRLTVDVLDNDVQACKVLVSTRGCDYTLHAGDLIAWPAALHEVGNLGNPGEMDYAAHLLHSEGIRYQQHLPVSKIKKVGHSPTLFTRLSNIRRHLGLKVFNTSLSPAAQRFVVALLLGNKRFIDNATRQEFSAAGVAHVLALSGLHVGFIALIIWWLLFPLDYLGWKRWRLVITLAAIAMFAVITVGALLLFARLPQVLESRYRLLNWLTTTAITTLVAMLATVALTAYYFHTVSLVSVLANLLILPILPVFMVLGAIFLLVTAAGMQWQVLNGALDAVYRYIHWAAEATSSLPGSHLSGIYVSAFGVAAYFVILAFVILWFYRRSYRYLLVAGCTFVILLGHSLWVDIKTPRQGLVTLSSFTSTPILYYSNGMGYVWIPDEEALDSADFARFYAGFMSRQNIHDLKFITGGDSLRMDDAIIRPPYAFLAGHRLLAAGSGKWKQATAISRQQPLDEIVITKRFQGSISRLQELYQFKQVVVSGAHYNSARLQRECDSLGVRVVKGYSRLK